MFKSSLCRVLSVVCVLLHCSALDVDKQQNGSQTKRQCLRNCFYQTTAQMNGTQLKSKVLQISSRQSCYEKCLQKLGKHDILGNQQTKPLFKRIKRDASSPQANSSEYNDSNGLCRNYTGDEDNLRGLAKKYINMLFYNITGRFYANISWNPPPETANWTGYRVIYANEDWQIKCTDVKKNVTWIFVFYDWKRYARLQIISLPLLEIGEGDGYSKFMIEKHLAKTTTVTKGQPSTATSPRTTSATTPYRQRSTATSPRTTSTTTPFLNSSKITNKTDEQTNPPSNPVSITLLVTTTASVAVTLIVVAAVVYWFFRRSSGMTPANADTEVLMERKWKFDAFIIYSSEDGKWVTKTLLSTLEKKYGLKCCIHYRDFVIGKAFRENMVDSVYKSRKTVAVISRSFLESTHCNNEMDMALHRLLERRDDSVVVIKLDDVDRERLPKALQERSYIDYPKSIKNNAWEKNLVDCLKVTVEHTSGNPGIIL